MPDDLKRIRERKGMSVAQLASRAGLSAQLIAEYEAGKPIPAFDRARLAKALYVDEADIRTQPPRGPAGAPPAPDKKPDRPAAPAQPAPPKVSPPPAPARPGQLEHLHMLRQSLQVTQEQMEAEIGKPLAELTLKEARRWLGHYQEQMAHSQSIHPPGYRSKRAHLPEAVDEFEMRYLTEAQASGAQLTVKTFNGEVFTGVLTGFGTYALTLRLADGSEVTLQKLAIAYYRTAPAGGVA